MRLHVLFNELMLSMDKRPCTKCIFASSMLLYVMKRKYKQ